MKTVCSRRACEQIMAIVGDETKQRLIKPMCIDYQVIYSPIGYDGNHKVGDKCYPRCLGIDDVQEDDWTLVCDSVTQHPAMPGTPMISPSNRHETVFVIRMLVNSIVPGESIVTLFDPFLFHIDVRGTMTRMEPQPWQLRVANDALQSLWSVAILSLLQSSIQDACLPELNHQRREQW